MDRQPNYRRVKVNRFSGSGFIPRIKLNISPEKLKGALNNDLVSFRVINSNEASIPGCRLEGEVIKIIERFKTRFVAEVISFSRKKLELFFDDPQLSGLKEVWGYFHEMKPGDKIVIQLNQFPPARMEGEVIKTLGNSSSGKVDFFSLIADLKLPGKFDDEKFQGEINKLTKLREKILYKNEVFYKNLENKSFFTVDGIKAKDFDDAICAEEKDGILKLYVAIADVWGYLNYCPNIFAEAKKRGTSIYLIDKVIPMLPPILSEDLCSLMEGKVKCTICLSVEIDSSSGIVQETTAKIFPAKIISKKRFNYQEMNQFLQINNEDENKKSYDPEVEKAVLTTYKIVQLIQKRNNSKDRQSLKIFQDKFELELNSKDELVSMSKNQLGGTPSQQLVETCMILANQLVAKFLEKAGILTLYRVHKTPEMERLKNFVEEVKELGCNFVVPEKELVGVNVLNEWLNDVKDSNYHKIIQFNLLQALPKAEYKLENIGHFGINSNHYVHFTSPIRRLPDLLVHKSLWMYIFLKDQVPGHLQINHESELKEMAYLSNITEQRSVLAEKRFSSRKIYKYLLEHKLNQTIEGVVMSRSPWGYTVSIDQIYDGFVRTQEKRLLGQTVKLRKVDYSWDEFVEC